MATYRSISTSETAHKAPVTVSLMVALAENPTAIAEGASGAPRIINDAIADATIGSEKLQSGTEEMYWVAGRFLALPAGAVGALVFGACGAINLTYGATVAGSSISPCSVIESGGLYDQIYLGSALSGTWRCLGQTRATAGDTNATLFQRVA